MSVHVLRLKNPRRSSLVKKCPKECYEEIERKKTKDDSQAFLGAKLSLEFFAIRLDMDKFPPTQPEEDSGQSHKNTRDAKGYMGAVPFQEPRSGKHGHECSKIDREIEPIENFGE